MRTELAGSPQGLAGLRDEWDGLLARNPAGTVFMTWEWAAAWWKVFGGEGRLMVILARGDGGDLRGVAPFFVQRTRYYGWPARVVSFIGTGLADRQDLVTAGGDGEAVAALMGRLEQESGAWDLVCLEQLPATSPVLGWEPGPGFLGSMEHCSVCPFVRIQGPWEDFQRGLSRKFKNDLRTKRNKLSRTAQWTVRCENPVRDAEELVAVMARVEEGSRKTRTGRAFMEAPGNRDFVLELAAACRGREWMDFSTLDIRGEPAAHLLGFHFGGSYAAYQMAYLDRFHEVSPGKLLLHEKMRRCFEGHEAEFDFLRGGTYIKTLWATESRTHSRLVLFKDGLRSRALRAAVFVARPLVKRLIGRRGPGAKEGEDV